MWLSKSKKEKLKKWIARRRKARDLKKKKNAPNRFKKLFQANV